MPYSWIQKMGRCIGTLLFYTMHKYRKRTLSNLAFATELSLSKQELIRTAKESFQNLCIICLEYPRLSREKKLSPHFICENPETAERLLGGGKGIIFFCGHLANWEILFLEGTSRMKGVAVAKPIQNARLYRWIVGIREKYGGKIIPQSHCIKEGLRALKQGSFVGVVGDQAMPSSGYCRPFLGRAAWTSTAPALLSYRTGCPIIFAETRRSPGGGYKIRYSEPIWPDQKAPPETEVPRLMDEALLLLQSSIKKCPGEWLWQHNRWKQQTPKNVIKRFRHDAICVILPPRAETLLAHLRTLREIYPLDFLFLIAPRGAKTDLAADETFYYSNIEEALLEDYRFKLVFNFTDCEKIQRHYLRLSAFEVLSLNDLKKLAPPHLDLSEVMKRALTRPGTLWHKEKADAR
jgi:KDO2-lipid IV(A) lauroyltransferase